MEYILSAIISVFTTLAFMLFSQAFATPKSNFPWLKRYFILYILFSVPQLIFTTAWADSFEFLELPLNLVLFSCGMVVMYHIRLKHSLLIISAFSILVFAVDFILLSVFSVVLGASIVEIIYSIPLFCIRAFTGQFINVTLCFLINKYFRAKRKQITVSAGQWLQIFLYISFCSFSLYFISSDAYKTGANSVSHVAYSLISVSLTLAMYALTTKLSEENETKQQNALLNQQLKLGMENIEALNSAYSQQRSLTHDFNNHLSVIHSLLENGDLQKASDYTTKLLNSSISVSRLFDSGNSVVDTLLTQKYNHAKNLGIKMQVLVEDLSGIAMSADKLVILLSNLLDNAIEACSATEGDKSIKLKFTLEDVGYILTVQNTSNQPLMENNSLVTTKDDKLNHGYGFKNICTVLEGYSYPYNFSYDNGWFTFTTIMYSND